VVEILKGGKTATQFAGEFAVHPVVLSAWKKQFLEMRPQTFIKPEKKEGGGACLGLVSAN
jgi:transposase-like protein